MFLNFIRKNTYFQKSDISKVSNLFNVPELNSVFDIIFLKTAS